MTYPSPKDTGFVGPSIVIGGAANMGIIDGATNAVVVCMGVKSGESVSIVSDAASEKIARSLYDVSLEITPRTSFILIPDIDEKHREPPPQVASAMKHSDVVFLATQKSLTHTQARIEANNSGARIASMPGINEYIFSRGGMVADYLELKSSIKKAYRRLKGAKKITVTSDGGTNIEMSVRGRNWVTGDTGICHKRGGFTNLPAGSIFIAPVENSASGVVYFDGGIEGDISQTIRFEIKEGTIQRVPKYAQLERFVDVNSRCALTLSQFGIGMNPSATVIGNILQDEKAWGTVHLGFGENKSFGGRIKCRYHFEGIIKSPTVEVDGKTIIENGNIVFL